MTKADLIATMAKEAKIPKVAAEEALNAFTDAVTKALKKGDKLTLTGFGTFSVVKRGARPKSTASPCLVRIRRLEGAVPRRNYRKKAMKEDPRRVLSCRSCLNPSCRAILDKVLLTASFKALSFSGFEQAFWAYPEGA